MNQVCNDANSMSLASKVGGNAEAQVDGACTLDYIGIAGN